MSHVFISYSHEDADFVTKLIKHLKKEQIPVWVDSEKLPAGTYWKKGIDDGIKSAFVLILVLSPHAVISPYVTYEWSFALGLGRKVIPVICSKLLFHENEQENRKLEAEFINQIATINQNYQVKIRKPEIHSHLSELQYIDLSGKNDTKNRQELIKQVKELQKNFQPQTIYIPHDAPPSVQSAGSKLDSFDIDERKKAIDSLASMESHFAEDVLISALKSSYPDVRYRSAEVLGQKRSKKAIPKLSYLVEDRNDDVRRFTVIALIRIGGGDVVPGLIKALKDKDREIVKKAVRELGNIGHSDAVPYLIQIDDNDYQVLQAIYQALGQIKSEEATPYLIDWLDKNSHDTTIIKSLGEIGSTDAIPHLIKRLEYAEYNTRQSAIEALINIGEKTIPYLIQILQGRSGYGYMKESVIEVLRKLNTPEAQEALKRIRGY